MYSRRTSTGVARPEPLSTLFVLAVLVLVLHAARAVGLCIVFRLGRRAVPGCVPAWSADRAPPSTAALA